MGFRYLSAASAIQLAVLTAVLAVCLNLSTGLRAHEARLYELYGDRVFSLQAVVTESGLPYRFDQHDLTVLRDALESEGIAVAGFSLSYIDAREVDPVFDGILTRTDQLRTRIALAEVTPLYFSIAGLPVRLAEPDLDLSNGEAYLFGDEAHLPGEGVHLCVISHDLASGLFRSASPVGHAVVVSGGTHLVVADEVMSDHLLPMIDEPAWTGLVHRPGRLVIYKPLVDPGASASFGYLLFEIQANASLMDGMKSVSRFLTTYYPELRSDVYSEHERFAEQSVSTRSALLVLIVATLIGYAIAGLGMYAEMLHKVTGGSSEMAVRIMAGATPASLFALILRRSLIRGVLAGAAGCMLYFVVSAIGVSLPALPPENVGVSVAPAIVSVAVACLTACAATVGPARRALTLDSFAGSESLSSARL